jgi:hypothetical protein
MWLLEIACTFLMFPKNDWCTTYDSDNSGLNNVARKIVGIGTIKIRMHDKIVRTLMNVRRIQN